MNKTISIGTPTDMLEKRGRIDDSQSPIVGISLNRVKPGESVDLITAGTIIVPIDDSHAWRSNISTFIDAALSLGIEVPKLVFHAGQIFWKDGQIVEARLSGYAVIGEPDADGKANAQGWQTPDAPEFTREERGALILAPKDAGRTHMTALAVNDESGKAVIVVTLNLIENQQIADKQLATHKENPTSRDLVESTVEFSFHTSQEMDALSLAQCDGKTFTSYMMNEQAGAIIHARAGSPHQIRMELTEDERAAGLALGYLESLARAQDADAVLATAYILGVLAPPSPLPARALASGWIDFDDVLNKIGWIPRNTKDRRELHAKIWSFVKFGERAQIIGKRTGAAYKDAEGNPIDTTIHGAAWRVMKTETPDPPALETPVQAQIAVSQELTALISNPKTAQYFQCGQFLGAIPGGKPAGAWARVIGLALMSFWRRKPREYDAGSLKPTRRELLSHFTAKISPYEEILASDKPGRAIDYWHGALQILADEGFIARTGEAAISVKEMKSGLPRKNWQAGWLNQSINIEVGTKTKPAFEIVLNALPALKARDLKKKPRAKKTQKHRQQTGGM